MLFWIVLFRQYCTLSMSVIVIFDSRHFWLRRPCELLNRKMGMSSVSGSPSYSSDSTYGKNQKPGFRCFSAPRPGLTPSFTVYHHSQSVLTKPYFITCIDNCMEKFGKFQDLTFCKWIVFTLSPIQSFIGQSCYTVQCTVYTVHFPINFFLDKFFKVKMVPFIRKAHCLLLVGLKNPRQSVS